MSEEKRTPIIGTRASALAQWQTQQVVKALVEQNVTVETRLIKSEGDLNQVTPLYEMGITGVFTRSLDRALLAGEIDIAVHSLKDVPTQLANGLVLVAVLPRGNSNDILVLRPDEQAPSFDEVATIATGSLRRRAQWLHRYPDHEVAPLRGNVQTRLKKLNESSWTGAVFAQAGLERLGLLSDLSYVELDWMIPAPAQGIIGIVCRESDLQQCASLQIINHAPTFKAAELERAFLRKLEGGCSAPIGAIATVSEDSYTLKAVLMTPDGEESIEAEWSQVGETPEHWGSTWANDVLESGGSEIMEEIKDAQSH
ncbi:UNVERIFIED_CONTAM: hypothetical protein GTU68_064891 [Idotea baltica]|nr:hypothetical protein [Idotea baltica]